MTYDYNRTSKTRMSITLENGVKVEGEFLELRFLLILYLKIRNGIR